MAVKGVDISQMNGSVDFTALKNADRAQLDSDDVTSFAVRQNEHYAIVKGHDLNDPDGRWKLNIVLSVEKGVDRKVSIL